MSRARSAPVLLALLLATTAVACARAGTPTNPAGPGDWPTYLYGTSHSGYDPASTITAANAATLHQKWVVRAGGAISAPVSILKGVAYWGSWDGFEHATSTATGRQLWRTQIGQETKADCYPPHLGVASSAALATVSIAGKPTLVDFVGGGAGSYFALNALTGKVIWSHSIGQTATGHFAWSSPVVVGTSVYVGSASIGDCPLTAGAVLKLNAATGAVQARFAVVPSGCTGGTVWGTPTVDPTTGEVYVATGNDSYQCRRPEPYAQSLVALTPNLTPISHWRIPQSQATGDSDFGTTPTLFTAKIDGVTRQLVGAVNKNGIYYAFRRGNLGAGPVWESPRVDAKQEDVSPSAWDGKRLYVAGSETTIGSRSCVGSLRALDPATGHFLWEDCFTDGFSYAAVVATPGVAWGSSGTLLFGVRASDGAILLREAEPSGGTFYGPPAFADGAMFIGSTNGWLRKFAPTR